MDLINEKFKIIGCTDSDSDSIVRPNITYWEDAWRRLKKNKIAIISLVGLLVIIIMCIFGPYISRFPYNKQAIELTNRPPSNIHWFGTDQLGRDIFSRIWIGGRVSITIGIVGTIVEIVLGCIYGGIAGYFGGRVDLVMMRIVEVIVGIPYLLVVVLISIVLSKGLVSLIIALCITGWVSMARIIRGQVMLLKESEYVIAAKLLGASPGRIISKHLIPNTIGVIIVYVSFDIPAFIFAESFLSFIGLGIQPPMTSWGAMAAFGQSQMDFYPHELIFPTLAISLTMLAFNLLGDGLRDALDPKLRQ
jgi:oligopeptide transport system permease protein